MLVSLGRTKSRWNMVAIGLVVGGAIGNIIDRLFRGDGWFRGAVVDFIDPQWFPIFNVADIGVTVGGFMLVLGHLLAFVRHEDAAEPVGASDRSEAPSDAAETLPAALDGERLDRVVAFMTDSSRAVAARLVDDGAVRRSTASSSRAASSASTKDRWSPSTRRRSASRPGAATGSRRSAFGVVYEDEAIIVVDKPAGLVVHPGSGNRTGTLVNGLLARYPESPGVGDPETGPASSTGSTPARPGCSSSPEPSERTRHCPRSSARAVPGGGTERLVWGHPTASVGVIEAPIGRSPRDPLRRAVVADGKPARTHYRVRAELSGPADVAELDCTLDTGRTHQIRVHLASVGHPLVGDTLYGAGRPVLGLVRPFLHAQELTIDHPDDW